LEAVIEFYVPREIRFIYANNQFELANSCLRSERRRDFRLEPRIPEKQANIFSTNSTRKDAVL
jgi:hypothetical protein